LKPYTEIASQCSWRSLYEPRKIFHGGKRSHPNPYPKEGAKAFRQSKKFYLLFHDKMPSIQAKIIFRSNLKNLINPINHSSDIIEILAGKTPTIGSKKNNQ
jgi:hypothetical protein